MRKPVTFIPGPRRRVAICVAVILMRQMVKPLDPLMLWLIAFSWCFSRPRLLVAIVFHHFPHGPRNHAEGPSRAAQLAKPSCGPPSDPNDAARVLRAHNLRVGAAARTSDASSPTAKTFVLVHRPRGRVFGEEFHDRRADEGQSIIEANSRHGSCLWRIASQQKS